jgi:hypothetical protein
MRRKTEPVSNEIDESDLQPEKLDEQIISTEREMIKHLIGVFSNARRPICVTRRLSTNDGKKTCDGTCTIEVRRPETSPITTACPPDAQTSTPPMKTLETDIVQMNFF